MKLKSYLSTTALISTLSFLCVLGEDTHAARPFGAQSSQADVFNFQPTPVEPELAVEEYGEAVSGDSLTESTVPFVGSDAPTLQQSLAPATRSSSQEKRVTSVATSEKSAPKAPKAKKQTKAEKKAEIRKEKREAARKAKEARVERKAEETRVETKAPARSNETPSFVQSAMTSNAASSAAAPKAVAAAAPAPVAAPLSAVEQARITLTGLGLAPNANNIAAVLALNGVAAVTADNITDAIALQTAAGGAVAVDAANLAAANALAAAGSAVNGANVVDAAALIAGGVAVDNANLVDANALAAAGSAVNGANVAAANALITAGVAAITPENIVDAAALIAGGVAVNNASLTAINALNNKGITPTAANVPTTIAALNALTTGIADGTGGTFDATDEPNRAAVTKIGGLGDLTAINAIPPHTGARAFDPIALDARHINAAKRIGGTDAYVATAALKTRNETGLGKKPYNNYTNINNEITTAAAASQAFSLNSTHAGHITNLWSPGGGSFNNLNRLNELKLTKSVDEKAAITTLHQDVALNAAKSILQGPLGINWVPNPNIHVQHVEELEEHLRQLADDENADLARKAELTQHADALRIVVAAVKTHRP